MKKRFSFLIVWTFVVLFLSCGKDPNPCAALKPVSAGFKFQENFYGIDSLFTTPDTVLSGSRVIMTADESGANYTWKVGDDPDVFTKQSFFIDFNQAYGAVPTTLILSKQPNKTCFPNDNGMDTLTRNLYVVDATKVKPAFIGTFTGYISDDPSKKFDVTIVDLGPTPNPDPLFPPGHYGYRVYNLPQGCGENNFTPSEYTPAITQYTYRSFYIESDVFPSSCGNTYSALGRVYSNNSKIQITFLDYDLTKHKLFPTKKQFIGNRKK